MVDLAGKSAFVTGAAGFIGANLVRALLERGAVVHALVRPGGSSIRLDEIRQRLQIHPLDLNDGGGLAAALQRIRPDYIFNLASPAGHPRTAGQKLQLLRTSVLGTASLLEAAAHLDFDCFIHFGSSTEYGSSARPLRESQRLEPTTFRGAAKAAAALLCQQFARERRLPLVILRPFSVYGYWEAPTRFIPTAILAALLDQELPLTQAGFRRDLIFIEDLVEASLLASGSPGLSGKTLNVGSGSQHLNEQVVALIESLTGKRIRVQAGAHPASPSDTAHWEADIRQARRHLGWVPRHSLEEGLQKDIAWMRDHLDLYLSWKASLSVR